MAHLLEALAHTPILQYPIRVSHTSDQVPDFQLEVGGRRIAVELTRIAFQDVEHGRALQQKGVRRTLAVSSVYSQPTGPRKRTEVMQEGFGRPAMVIPLSPDEQHRIWCEQARASLDAKTLVVAGKAFAHGDEDWLVLVDPVGRMKSEVEPLGDNFSQLLTRFWTPGWFSRVFLQDNFFLWQIAFTKEESSVLPQP